MRVLVVDDEPGIRKVFRRALERPGVDVEAVDSGDEALRRLDRGFDLVVTDIAMPGKADGIEVLGRAREAGASVIVMTAYPDLGSALAALRRRAVDYLVKPFSVEELRGAVERWKAGREEGRPGGDAGAARPVPALPAPDSRVATALFADVRGFTRFAAGATAREAGSALDELLSPAMEAVRACGGAVQQVLGDGFLALFGGGADDGAAAAARGALAAREAAWAACRARRSRGLEPLAMGFGLDTGEVLAEALGEGEHGQPVFVGHAVNVAARLEKAAGPGVVLAGPGSAPRLLGLFRLEPVPPLSLRGLEKEVAAFELLDQV